jgi:hypothetical protein
MTIWSRRIRDRLDGIRHADRWRSIRTLDGPLPVAVLDGAPVVSFASND